MTLGGSCASSDGTPTYPRPVNAGGMQAVVTIIGFPHDERRQPRQSLGGVVKPPHMESDSVTVSSTIGFWTHYRASRAVASRSLGAYIGWGFFVGVPLLLVIVMLCRGQDVFDPDTFGLPAWGPLMAGLLFMLGFMPLFHLLQVAGFRRRSPATGGVQTYTITRDGYTMQGNFFDTTLKWGAFLKVIETKEFILLYISGRMAHFIPKAAATTADLQKIRTIVHEKFGAKAKLGVG